MAQFNYTLPSGATFTMQAPEGTTQAQADYTFYSQVAAGALVGFLPGQSVSGTTSALAKFELSRLDRGTAGVDDTVILAIINGLPTINTTTGAIPSLVNTPLTNPVTQANIAAIAGTGFTAPAIGSLTSIQTQTLMAQVVNTVDQPAATITSTKGVGKYGLSCQQLEIAGYVKPGTWQQFIQNGPSTVVEVLNAPAIWTGLNGIYSLDEFLNGPSAQNNAQARLMQNGYESLQAAGVITTPEAQSVSAVVGTVYTGSNAALTTATTTITNDVNSQVAALITNSSQYGTELTAQWANDLPPVTGATSNQISIQGITPVAGTVRGIPEVGSLISGITPNLMSVKTAMDTLGKASQFAATASSTLTSGLNSLSNLSVSGLTDKLSNISVGGLADKLGGSATALAGQIQGQIAGQANALVGQIQGQANALIGQAQAQANALIAQAQSQVNSLIAQGQGLVAGVEKAAGFANTVNRATVDTAFTKILGSAKIPVPSFGADLPDSASIGAALDISKAQAALKNLQGQGTALLNQAQGLAGQAQGLANQAQGQANNLLASARTSVNQII
jgi:hypothetical protein